MDLDVIFVLAMANQVFPSQFRAGDPKTQNGGKLPHILIGGINGGKLPQILKRGMAENCSIS